MTTKPGEGMAYFASSDFTDLRVDRAAATRAARYVASRARDAADAELLLDALGLLPAVAS